MRMGLAALCVMSAGCAQGAQARPVMDMTGITTASAAIIGGLSLNRKDTLRLRTEVAPGLSGDRAFVRRKASSMVDYMPLGEGFRVSAGLRFDPKQPRGSMGRLANGAGAGLIVDPLNARRRFSEPRGINPAMTMGYTMSPARNMTLGIEAGAVVDHDRRPLATGSMERMASAQMLRQQVSGRGERDIGEVVRLSFARKF
ncbi:hypothetical protein PQ455_08675 [Sphingomonas naphthae]|uniref:Uncharacterized protein n=1 Tax=Sphingomonas naphthae TaxID=1813468 RepID=A0ABY7TQL5_9SPHN|nr:hypothetical protein [Sphingomonas naphthae]WCT75276.1 hypothetical protein PQ455_08675 [Sphingomonas naphthae]